VNTGGSALRQAGERQRQAHIGLETLLEQLGYLASVGDNQTLMLESTLDELPDIQQGFDAVMTAWQNGDEATLINLLREEMAPPSCKPGWNRPCWRSATATGSRSGPACRTRALSW
jgi:uncharacterized protein YbaP (TraB family)